MEKEKKEHEDKKSGSQTPGTIEAEELDLFEELNISESTDKGMQGDDLSPKNEKEITSDELSEKSPVEDELWDSGDKIDNVPLFEEFASELLEHDERGGEPLPEPDIQSEIQSNDSVANIYSESEHESEITDQLTKKSDDIENTEEAINEDVNEKIRQIEIGTENPLLLWGLIGIVLVLIIAGGAAVWKMTGTTLNPSTTSNSYQKIIANENTKHQQSTDNKKPASNVNQSGELQKTPDFNKITLAPFLIPARQNGEMAFFNLQVELLAKDQKTADALQQKEIWIRDIIYRELKDIDISKGLQKDLLAQYQKPIIDHINTELTPLRVEDVRLSGSLIK